MSGIPGSACSDSLNPVLGIWVGGDWGGFSENFGLQQAYGLEGTLPKLWEGLRPLAGGPAFLDVFRYMWALVNSYQFPGRPGHLVLQLEPVYRTTPHGSIYVCMSQIVNIPCDLLITWKTKLQK